MSLKGKHALVTEAHAESEEASIALKLAEKGVRVGVHYHQNKSAAKATLAKIRECGSDGFVVQADVCRPEEVSRLFSRVKAEFGELDIFVHNARPDLPGFYTGPMNITLEQWDTALDSQAKAFLGRRP